MARNLKSQGSRVRRLGIGLTDKQQKILSKRPTPPGQHGGKGNPRQSEYGKQLAEKQKAKFIYGILERQMRNTFRKASGMAGDTGEIIFRILETRLDNVVYRAGFTKTRPQARQLVGHNHILVNGKKVNIPSYVVKVGDVVEVKPATQKVKLFTDAKENFKNIQPVSWLNTNIEKATVKMTDMPKAADMTGEFNTKAVVEFYSR